MSTASQPVDPGQALTDCERILGYTFADQELLRRCVTHSSAAATRLESNERLEFLGDAILGAVVSERLYRLFPEYPEGDLTRHKSVLVSRETCANVTRRLGLDQVVLVGKGVRSQSKIPMSILAAIYEAVIGGLYLDGGFEAARTVINETLAEEFDRVGEDLTHNYKSILQQLAQKDFGNTPSYRLLDEQGPDHSKCFKIAAVIGDQVFPAAWGNNKKQAEQRAAENALAMLDDLEIPHSCD